MVLLSDFRHEVTNKNNRIHKDYPMSLAHFMNWKMSVAKNLYGLLLYQQSRRDGIKQDKKK